VPFRFRYLHPLFVLVKFIGCQWEVGHKSLSFFFIELKEARDSSRKAQRTATIAIIIAITLGLLELTFGVIGLLIDRSSNYVLV